MNLLAVNSLILEVDSLISLQRESMFAHHLARVAVGFSTCKEDTVLGPIDPSVSENERVFFGGLHSRLALLHYQRGEELNNFSKTKCFRHV